MGKPKTSKTLKLDRIKLIEIGKSMTYKVMGPHQRREKEML